MRGLGTPTNGIYPGYLRRIDGGVVQAAGSQAGSLGLWMLQTNDTAATVEGAGYMNAWYSDLPIGSIIMAAMDLGGTPKLKHYVVSANTGGVVTLTKSVVTAG